MSERSFTTSYRHMVVLNYKVDEDLLRSFLPLGLELDGYKGSYYLSVVGCLSFDTKIKSMRLPFHKELQIVSFRFYVKRKIGRKVRRGFVDINRSFSRSLMAMMEEKILCQKTTTVKMNHKIDFNLREVALGGRVEYQWGKGLENHIAVLTDGDAKVPAESSLEFFLTERFFGYSKQKDGTTLEHEVRHPSWKVTKVIESSAFFMSGKLSIPELEPILDKEPCSAFLVEGSEVEIFSGVRI